MTESGARRTLQRLVQTGLVEKTGEGKGTQYVLCREGMLARQVARLFEVERDWGNALVQTLRKTLQGLRNPPKVAWARDCSTEGSDSREVAVFWEGVVRTDWLADLEEHLTAVEENFESSLEIRNYSRDEMDEVDWSEVVMLLGASRVDGATAPGETASVADAQTGTGNLDPESPEFSGALVALLEEDLSVLRRARENVQGRLKRERNGNGYDLWEWQKILDTFSLPRLLSFLGSESPRAVRLRECSPFPAVLSQEERARLAELANRPH